MTPRSDATGRLCGAVLALAACGPSNVRYPGDDACGPDEIRIDDVCVLAEVDADGDGVPTGEDCDDTDPFRSAGERSYAGIELRDQALVDAFCGGACVATAAVVRVQGDDIVDLLGLSCLVETEMLSLSYNPALTGVDGLERLTRAPSALAIHGNNALTDLDGLSALELVGSLHIVSNLALPSAEVEAFVDGIDAIGEEVQVYGNGP